MVDLELMPIRLVSPKEAGPANSFESECRCLTNDLKISLCNTANRFKTIKIMKSDLKFWNSKVSFEANQRINC